MNTCRITGLDCKLQDFSMFVRDWNNEVDFILNGLSDYGEVNSSNGYLNKKEYISMYDDVFKNKFIEIITDKGNYVISSNLLLNV